MASIFSLTYIIGSRAASFKRPKTSRRVCVSVCCLSMCLQIWCYLGNKTLQGFVSNREHSRLVTSSMSSYFWRHNIQSRRIRKLGGSTVRVDPLSPIHTADADADATQLSSWVASAVCIEFATSWRQSRRVWTICRQRSRVASCRRCERTSRQSWPSFQFSAPVTYRLQNCKLGHDSRRVCTLYTPPTTELDRINSQHVQFSNFRRQSSWASCEFNTHRRHRRDADATQLDSWVASASAVCIGYYGNNGDLSRESANLCHTGLQLGVYRSGIFVPSGMYLKGVGNLAASRCCPSAKYQNELIRQTSAILLNFYRDTNTIKKGLYVQGAVTIHHV